MRNNQIVSQKYVKSPKKGNHWLRNGTADERREWIRPGIDERWRRILQKQTNVPSELKKKTYQEEKNYY